MSFTYWARTKNQMKYLTILILVASGFVAITHAAIAQSHLFILSGQSNMARLDPSISFTPAVEAEFGVDNVTIVKDAQGGQPIRRWYKKWQSLQGDSKSTNGDLYDRLMEKVNQAIGEDNFDTITFLWMQGERDAKEKHGEVYAASFKGLIAQLSEDLGNKEINFVIGRLSDFDMGNKKFPHWTMIREAQVELAEGSPQGAWVNTDDLNDGLNQMGQLIYNDLHYSVDGYKEFGNRLARACILNIKQQAQPVDGQQ